MIKNLAQITDQETDADHGDASRRCLQRSLAPAQRLGMEQGHGLRGEVKIHDDLETSLLIALGMPAGQITFIQKAVEVGGIGPSRKDKKMAGRRKALHLLEDISRTIRHVVSVIW